MIQGLIVDIDEECCEGQLHSIGTTLLRVIANKAVVDITIDYLILAFLQEVALITAFFKCGIEDVILVVAQLLLFILPYDHIIRVDYPRCIVLPLYLLYFDWSENLWQSVILQAIQVYTYTVQKL